MEQGEAESGMSSYGFWLYNSKCGLVGKASTLVELPNGSKLLKKDPDEPAVMEDADILYCIGHSPRARYDFNWLFPTLDANSQYRLTLMLAQNPRVSQLLGSDQNFADHVQHVEVTSGVHPDIETRPARIDTDQNHPRRDDKP